ncbi:hypothetical protein ACVWZJ_000990, partial [Thermostichus sp. OS-CIW-29]
GSRNPPRRLRKEPSMRSVVGISGLKAGEDVNFPVSPSSLAQLGANGLIGKPFNAATLAADICALLGWDP